MGSFYIGCKVENHQDPKKVAVVPKLLVDTGSEFTWLPGSTLERIGVEPQKKDIQIQMANGEVLTRTVGFAVLRVDKFFTIDEVVFAQKGDLSLLGSRALEGMNLQVDARRKKLVGAGPVIAATAIRPEVAKAIGIVVPGRKPRPSVNLMKRTPKKRAASKPSPQ
jgi:predicted aspartyl protease